MGKAEEFEAVKNALRERHETQEAANAAGVKALCYVVDNLDLIPRALRRDAACEDPSSLDAETIAKIGEVIAEGQINAGHSLRWRDLASDALNAIRESVK